MKKRNLFAEHGFNALHMSRFLVHDSPYFKVLNFNFEPGQELPLHNHNVEGQLSILVLEGEGLFLGEGKELPAVPGDVLISEISEPHGVRARTRMRILVTIAPPI